MRVVAILLTINDISLLYRPSLFYYNDVVPCKLKRRRGPTPMTGNISLLHCSLVCLPHYSWLRSEAGLRDNKILHNVILLP